MEGWRGGGARVQRTNDIGCKLPGPTIESVTPIPLTVIESGDYLYPQLYTIR